MLVVYFWRCWFNNVTRLHTTKAAPVQLEAERLAWLSTANVDPLGPLLGKQEFYHWDV